MASDFFPFQTPVGPMQIPVESLAVRGAMAGAQVGQSITPPMVAIEKGLEGAVKNYQSGVEFDQRKQLNDQIIQENQLKLQEEQALQEQRIKAKQEAYALQIQQDQDERALIETLKNPDIEAKKVALMGGGFDGVFAKNPKYQEILANQIGAAEGFNDPQSEVYLANLYSKLNGGLFGSDINKHYENYQTAQTKLTQDINLNQALAKSKQYRMPDGNANLQQWIDDNQNDPRRFEWQPQGRWQIDDPDKGTPKIDKVTGKVVELPVDTETAKAWMVRDTRTGNIILNDVPTESKKEFENYMGSKSALISATQSAGVGGNYVSRAMRRALQSVHGSNVSPSLSNVGASQGAPAAPRQRQPFTQTVPSVKASQPKPQAPAASAPAAEPTKPTSLPDLNRNLARINLNDEGNTEVTAALVASTLGAAPEEAQKMLPRIQELIQAQHPLNATASEKQTAPDANEIVTDILKAKYEKERDSLTAEYTPEVVAEHNNKATIYENMLKSGGGPAQWIDRQFLYLSLMKDGTLLRVDSPMDLYVAKNRGAALSRLNEALKSIKQARVEQLAQDFAPPIGGGYFNQSRVQS